MCDASCMVCGSHMGHHNSWPRPILLLPLPECHNHWRMYFSHTADSSLTWYQIVAQLISFPIMRLWARFMPQVKIFGMSLNPGPFSIKEHVIITIMANVGSGSAYAVSSQVYVVTLTPRLHSFRPTSLRSSGCSTTRILPLDTLGFW